MDRMALVWRRPVVRIAAAALLVLLGLAGAAQLSLGQVKAADGGSCTLGSNGQIQHVIYIQFDNTHFTRDNPNVPSDLEQMPHLLNFIQNNGVLDDNQHTPLIAHTATDILTSLTGRYPSNHGVPISNSYRYFKPDGTSSLGVSFAYWTSPVFDPTPSTPKDPAYNMISGAPTVSNPKGTNTPAPWVPYTRAGCNFGAVATANTILENTGIDVPTVFGANSPEAQEVQQDGQSTDPKVQAQPQADFVGIGVHCAQGSAICSDANHARPDLLPDEPGSYTGFNGLFGAKYVDPVISPNGPVTDMNGNSIQDPHGNLGFPGFDGMSAAVSLGYVAQMQEQGVPVTYAYISDAHDAHPNGPAYGPGQAGYVSALQAYDQAFGKFFDRLAKDGINKSNTLFVFTADEGDHFVGGAPSPAGCNGVTVPCTYSQIGELNGNLAGLLATEEGITTPFTVHSDSAPNFYVTGDPSQTDPTLRTLERGVGNLTAVNLLTGNTDTLTNFLADQTEQTLLHMMSADTARNPNFTMFALPDYFLFAGARNCNSPCVTEQPGFAWNHGDVSPDINTTWLGMVGPGIAHLGVNHTWADHTDTRPTMMAVLHLTDDYTHDGRVLFDLIETSQLPQSLRAHQETLRRLAEIYKEINAPLNQLGLDSLVISTKAVESGNAADDSTYTNLENQLAQFTTTRDNLASQMIAMLEGAAFNGHAINEGAAKQLISQAQQLLEQVHHLAESVG